MIRGMHLSTFAALSEVEVTAIAYEEAAEGDLTRALRWALEDLIATEQRLAETERAVSRGYVRTRFASTHAAF